MSTRGGFLERGFVRADEVGIEYRFGKSLGVGGVDVAAVEAELPRARQAGAAFRDLLETGRAAGMDEPVLWPRVTPPAQLAPIEAWARGARQADLILSIRIGGS